MGPADIRTLATLSDYRSARVCSLLYFSIQTLIFNIEVSYSESIRSDEFTNGNPHSFLGLSTTSQLASQQILARIAIDYKNYPFGSTLIAEKNSLSLSDIRRYSNEVDLQRLNIRLADEFGKVIDLNGTNISMCLELEHL